MAVALILAVILSNVLLSSVLGLPSLNCPAEGNDYGVWEVRANDMHNTIKCRGPDLDQEISMEIVDIPTQPDLDPNFANKPPFAILGYCPLVLPTFSEGCESNKLKGATLIRGIDTTSSGKTHHSVTLGLNLRYLGADNLFGKGVACRSPYGTDLCIIDVIEDPSDVTCRAEYVTPPNHAWSLKIRCDVTGGTSKLEDYMCRWFSTLQGDDMSLLKEVALNGLNGTRTCQATVDFPKGQLTILDVLVTPGRSYPPVVFEGGETAHQSMHLPSPSHDCPSELTSENVTCTCGGDVGKPAGLARWAGTKSSRVTLTTDMLGQEFTCTVLYNGQTFSTPAFVLHEPETADTMVIVGSVLGGVGALVALASAVILVRNRCN